MLLFVKAEPRKQGGLAVLMLWSEVREGERVAGARARKREKNVEGRQKGLANVQNIV